MKFFKLSLYFIFCLFISLEIVMRLGGFFAQLPGTIEEQKSFDPKAKHNIVVLGESTSADYYSNGLSNSWPSLLRRNLRDQGHSINLFNLSTPGTTTALLVKKLSDFLINHSVDVVIAMMGTNDRVGITYRQPEGSPLANLKVIQLFTWLYSYVLKGVPPLPNRAHVSDFFDPRLDSWAEQVVNGQVDQVVSEIKTLEGCKRGINFGELTSILNVKYQRYGNFPYQVTFAKEMIDACPDDAFTQFWFSWLHSVHPDNEDLKERALKIIKKYGNNLEEGTLANFYGSSYNSKNSEVEDHMKKMGLKIAGGFEYEKGVSQNFKVLKEICDKHGLKLFIMQYPTLPLEQFSKLFNIEQFKNDGVVFIDNEDNFKQILAQKPYEYLFTDRFRETWGHTTPVGHQMIADQVRRALEEHYFTKEENRNF